VTTAIDSALAERIRSRNWYHAIEVAPGLVTPGWFDLRPYVHHYGLPERLDGLRALEIGTWDGFWAFEMERRGADVVAIDLDDERDLDWPPRRRPQDFPPGARGEGFALAAEALGSRVVRRNLSVYDATPAELGTFDLIFCGSVLIHLRDQLLALERIAELCRGTFISAEEYDWVAGLFPLPVARFRADDPSAVVFWRPSARTWRRMMWTAGFDEIERHARFRMRSTEDFAIPHVVHHCRRLAGPRPGQANV
jgi:tRNA (mo5U34)-methyltransferase